ncbi:MAG: 4Fe-4S binding protein [Actinobacteria bacterium]|nr:4Fe-4S binding protein [Actinomycetota bacterium]
MWIPILILTAIGLLCGVLIWVTNRTLPPEPQSLKKAEEVSEKLPGMNCGACGFPGCFAYAQALAKDKNVFFSNTCTTVLQDQYMLGNLERSLNLKIDKDAMNKKAVVCCTGNCENIGTYLGVGSCKSANKILRGFKRCPYGCLGLGDCIEICPQNAISIDIDKKIAFIDPNKCIGCGLCVKECPRKIIRLVPADGKVVFLCSYEGLKNIPGREKCDFGCIRCRKCVKACENNSITWNEEKSIPEINYNKCTSCDACILACPNNVLRKLADINMELKKISK